MVPFVLRWLQADANVQPDHMYELLDYCTQQLQADADLAATTQSLRSTQRLHSISLIDDDFHNMNNQQGNPQSDQEKHVQRWARRQHMVVCNLVNRHVRYCQVPVSASAYVSWQRNVCRHQPMLQSMHMARCSSVLHLPLLIFVAYAVDTYWQVSASVFA